MSSAYISNKTGRARKAHECRVCGETIKPGEECHIYRGVEDGEGFYTIYFHPECWEYSRDWDLYDWESILPGAIRRPSPVSFEEDDGHTPPRPTIVCLCGSGRFKEAFERAEFDETLAGKIVLTIGCNVHDVARTPDLSKHKPMLDELHLRKIDISDEVYILNVGGYIGESTARELAYAKARGKVVKFLEHECCGEEK